MEDTDFFRKNGYVLIRNYFTQEEANKISEIADELENWEETKTKWMIYFEKNRKKSRIEHFVYYHPTLHDLLASRVYPIVDTISEKKNFLFKDKLNWKHDGGLGFRAHQDHPAWSDFDPDVYISAALFANNSTLENGCLQFGKGKNKFNMECDYNKEGIGELTNEIEDNLEWSLSETTPRDILLFDSFVPHRSDENQTTNSRRIFYFTFNDKKYGYLYNKYFLNKRKYFPPDIERTTNVNTTNNKYNIANPIV